MKVNMFVAEPDNVEMTLLVTMTLKEWSRIKDALYKQGVNYELINHIASAISTVEKTFRPEPAPEPE